MLRHYEDQFDLAEKEIERDSGDGCCDEGDAGVHQAADEDLPAVEMTEFEDLQKQLAGWRRVQALGADEIRSIEEQLQAIAA